MKKFVLAGLAFVACIAGSYAKAGSEVYTWLEGRPDVHDHSIGARICVPPGYTRLIAAQGSFAQWLRGLPLMPADSPVRLYPVSNGEIKKPGDVHSAVVDLNVLRFQQCADALIRLRAEYLWSVKRTDEVCFSFTSGDACCWKDWKTGLRPVVNGSEVGWRPSAVASSSRQTFMDYTDNVMQYAGTASLERDLQDISPAEAQIGDIIIEAGNPGHAVMILDMAANAEGEKLMLLGQSFMPSQEFHILKNSDGTLSPWYKVKDTGTLDTPEWRFDYEHDFKRFSP